MHWLCICCSTAKRVLVGFSGSSLAPFFIWYRVMSCHARQSGRQPSPACFVDRHIYIDSGGPWKGVPRVVGKVTFLRAGFLGAVGGTYTQKHTTLPTYYKTNFLCESRPETWVWVFLTSAWSFQDLASLSRFGLAWLWPGGEAGTLYADSSIITLSKKSQAPNITCAYLRVRCDSVSMSYVSRYSCSHCRCACEST